jgi:hypothetical protein
MDANSKINEPETGGGMSGLLRAAAALAVLVLALIGILAVLDVIPAELLREWGTKIGLVILILVAAAVAIAALARGRGKS